MKTDIKKLKKPKRHKPNLNGPYSVEPKKDRIDEISPDGSEEKKIIERDKEKKDPAIIDRQE